MWCNPYQNPSGRFGDIYKLILKCIWKCKGFRIDKTALKKKKKNERTSITSFQGFLYSCGSQDGVALVSRYTVRSVEENSKFINRPTPVSTTNFWNRYRGNWVEKRYSLNKWCWRNGMLSYFMLKNVYLYFMPYSKIRFKWVIDLNVKPKTVRCL